jgi:peptide/nickel transport system substrate-binding protein
MKSIIKKVVCVPLCVIMLLSFSACGGGNDTKKTTEPQSKNGHKDFITIGITDEPNSYNPYCATSTAGDTVFDYIYDRLVYTDSKGNFSPRLADKWESSNDGKVITFHLNPKVKWHDGEPFTAKDMVFAAQVGSSKDSTVTRRSYFSSLEGTDDNGVCTDLTKLGVVAVDDHTLEYYFKKPIAVSTFLYVDAQRYYPIPYHILKDVPMAQMEKNDYWKHPIGTGAFKFDSNVSGESITLTANKDYFLGAPNVDRIVFKKMDASNFAAGLTSGQIDLADQVPLADMQLLQSTKGLNAKTVPSLLYTYMSVNCSKDYFKDVRVRRALSEAIDRKTIVKQALYGFGDIAVSSLTANNPYFNKEVDGDPYNPEDAKKLLQEAGWDFNRELTFVSYNSNPARVVATTIIQQNLKAIGVNVKVQIVDWPTLIDMNRQGKFDLSILGGAGSFDPDDSRVLMQPGGAQNFCQITDPRYYDLAQKGHATVSKEEKTKIYYEYQKLLHDEPTYIWLYHNDEAVVAKDTIQNMPMEDFINLNYKAYAWTFTE